MDVRTCKHTGTTTVFLALLAALISACSGAERAGAPAVSADTIVTAVLPPDLTFAPEDTVLPTPLTRVTDGVGRPLSSVPVTFAVTDGGGTVEGATATTDARGLAQPLHWVLGRGAGLNRLTATVGSKTATFAVTVPVGAVAKLNWRLVGTPVENGLLGVALDPEIEGRWYAWSNSSGVFVTTDAGATWRHVLDASGLSSNGFAIHPRDPNTLLASAGTQLYVSTDRGETWTVRYTFPYFIRSILVSARDASVYVAPQWPDGAVVPGIYKSVDGGGTFTHYPYGVPAGTQMLTWDVFEDPRTGDLYTGNEIANHPFPYQPPVLRSQDGGATWTNANGDITWHVLKFSADIATNRLYAVAEGPGLYVAMSGGSFQSVSGDVHVTNDVLADAHRPGWVYAAQIVSGKLVGGVYASSAGGIGLSSIGLTGKTITGLALNREGTELYAVSLGDGIYKATLPAPDSPMNARR